MISGHQIKELLVRPGKKAKLKHRDTAWTYAEELADGDKQVKEKARALIEENRAELTKAQSVLYASATRAVLVILQGMDAAGKDGTIKHVMSGVNPQGCRVASFKKPTAEEKAHDFLWRYAHHVPERGMIGIFNRSYYEDVLIVRVHPEFLGSLQPADKKHAGEFWQARFDDINAYERHLTHNGTVVLKFFLHISREEQRKRLLDRLSDPAKRWKFSAADLAERSRWKDYLEAYEEALTATSTEQAPWYVVPADHKWVARAVVADIVSRTVRSLDLKYPTVPPEEEVPLEAARRALEAELS